MVTVKKVDKERLEYLVRISYKDDIEGFNKYHLEKYSYEEAVQKTLGMAEGMAEQTELNYFEVLFNETPIGYFITFTECLYSFAIAKHYRVKYSVLNEWWELVKSTLASVFVCIIYRNNTRAISFLQRMGMVETESDFEDSNIITLVNI